MKERHILHCDCNGFYASVELLSCPELRDKPVAVGGDGETRHGIVLAKNEAAKRYGVVTRETLWSARKKCPDLIVLSPHRDQYSKYSKIINGIYTRYTDLVQPFGIDESWLDVTDTYSQFADSPRRLADIIRERVREETGLTISVGVSFNKVFAKLGSDYKKPDATTIISPDNYKEIVHPLPVNTLLYVGKSTRDALEKMGVHTIGQLAALPQETLQSRFGKHGLELYKYANGLDDDPVTNFYAEKEVKSVGSGSTFSRNLEDLSDIKPALMSLSEDVGKRLRRYSLYANTISLTIRYPDFYTFSRQMPVRSTFVTKEIFDAALELFVKNTKPGQPIRALTVTAMDLDKDRRASQISLFGEGDTTDNRQSEKNEKLQNAIDKIRDKYGVSSLKNASVMASDITGYKTDGSWDKNKK